jgi:alanine transaminase
MVGFQDAVKEQVYKLASIGLCPNLVGQVVVDVMVNPPKPGEESYELCIL